MFESAHDSVARRFQDADVQPITAPHAEQLRRLVVDVTNHTGQRPIIAQLPPPPASHVDWTSIIKWLLVGVAVVVMTCLLIVACHETPQVHEHVDKSDCKLLCF